MNTPNPIFDIEALLNAKTYHELSESEKSFLLQHLGSEMQIKAYQNMLQETRNSLKAVNMPELRPNVAIKARLRQKLQPQQTFKSGFEQLLLTFFGWFDVRSPMASGLAVAFMVIAFWYGGNLEQTVNYNMDNFAKDSVAMEQMIDTSLAVRDSNELRVKQPYIQYHNFVTDSFRLNLNAIIRY